jgi:hypothetical protein
MTIGKRLGVLALSVLACTGALAQVTCVQCKAAALAEASQCRAQAAPDSQLLATCDRNYADTSQVCQETACRAEAGAGVAAQCVDCVKQAEADTKKCAAMPPEVRAACEARAATARKACEDKSCPAAKPR